MRLADGSDAAEIVSDSVVEDHQAATQGGACQRILRDARVDWNMADMNGHGETEASVSQTGRGLYGEERLCVVV
jgi:hypothetical protein